MTVRTIGLPAIVLLGAAALLLGSAGCDAKGEAATGAGGAGDAFSSTTPATSAAADSPATVSKAATIPSPEVGGPEAPAADDSKPADAAQASSAPRDAGAALRSAIDQDKYLFLAFYSPDGAGNDDLLKAFAEAEEALGDRAAFYTANVRDSKERPMVEEYQVARGALPLTLVFASNGAFVNAFQGKIATRKEMEASFLSAKFAETVKALQDRKIVLLCVQGKATRYNAESLTAARGASEMKEARGMIAVVEMAPEDGESKDLLAQLGVGPTLQDATVFVLLPPRTLAGKVAGSTTKEAVWQAIVRGASSCGSGCGPSGCGPSAAR